jgi:hypothetical protein
MRKNGSVFFEGSNLPFSTGSQGKPQGTPIDREREKQNTIHNQLRETHRPCGNWSGKRRETEREKWRASVESHWRISVISVSQENIKVSGEEHIDKTLKRVCSKATASSVTSWPANKE